MLRGCQVKWIEEGLSVLAVVVLLLLPVLEAHSWGQYAAVRERFRAREARYEKEL